MAPGNRLERYWNKQYLIEQLSNGKNYLDIARDNNVGKSTIQRVLHHHRLTKSPVRWSEQELSALKKLYGSERNFKAYFPRRKLGSIYHKASRLGLQNHVKPRKYDVDEAFFTKWNSEMAYVLGWMYSDGCVYSDKRTFEIKISIRDLSILEKIRKALRSESPLKTFAQKLPSGKAYGRYARLRINSHPMCNDLINLGCGPDKSHKIAIPSMPPAILKHFIRGYFDGDGSISFNKPNTIRLRFVSCSEKFVVNLAKVFRIAVGIPINHKNSHKNIWKCDYYGDNARKICEWMYEDCGDLFLERKRNRFIEHINRRRWHA